MDFYEDEDEYPVSVTGLNPVLRSKQREFERVRSDIMDRYRFMQKAAPVLHAKHNSFAETMEMVDNLYNAIEAKFRAEFNALKARFTEE